MAMQDARTPCAGGESVCCPWTGLFLAIRAVEAAEKCAEIPKPRATGQRLTHSVSAEHIIVHFTF
jgi:hypothetical protein